MQITARPFTVKHRHRPRSVVQPSAKIALPPARATAPKVNAARGSKIDIPDRQFTIRLPRIMNEMLLGKPVVIALRAGPLVRGTLAEIQGAGTWLILSGALIQSNDAKRDIGVLCISVASIGHLHLDPMLIDSDTPASADAAGEESTP